jgi:hypothetical protein
MAKGTPVKEGKAGERKYKDIDKTANKNRKPLSPRAVYGHTMHAGPQHIPASEIGHNMADDLWDQEMTRDVFGDQTRGPASSKAVAGKLKNVMKSKDDYDDSDAAAEAGHGAFYDDEDNVDQDGNPMTPAEWNRPDSPPVYPPGYKPGDTIPFNSKPVSREKKRPPIPPYKPKGSTQTKKIPARGKPKLPLTGLARYGNQVR